MARLFPCLLLVASSCGGIEAKLNRGAVVGTASSFSDCVDRRAYLEAYVALEQKLTRESDERRQVRAGGMAPSEVLLQAMGSSQAAACEQTRGLSVSASSQNECPLHRGGGEGSQRLVEVLGARATGAERPDVATFQSTGLVQVLDALDVTRHVLMYAFVDGRLVAILVRRSGVSFFDLGVSEERVTQAVTGLRTEILKGPGASSDSKWLSYAIYLYNRLLRPLEDHIPTDSVVTVVASGSISQIPFAALVRQDAAGSGGTGLNSQYALETWSFSYSPTSSRIVADALSSPRPLSVLVFGDPLNEALQVETQLFSPLPSAGMEAHTVAAAFSSSRLFWGSNATEAAFKKMAHKFSAIHLATHGKMLASAPGASFLLFADGEGEDGLLTVQEVLSLGLNADLVVLSACETAVGESESGGLATMSDAFVAAGASSVLATLWQVDDAATSVLMSELYARYGTLPKALLVREAQRILANSLEYSHPFYWAPFVLWGDVR